MVLSFDGYGDGFGKTQFGWVGAVGMEGGARDRWRAALNRVQF